MSREVKTMHPRVTGASQVPAICSSGVALVSIPTQRRSQPEDLELSADTEFGPLFTRRRPFEVVADTPAPMASGRSRLRRATASPYTTMIIVLALVAVLLGGAVAVVAHLRSPAQAPPAASAPVLATSAAPALARS